MKAMKRAIVAVVIIGIVLIVASILRRGVSARDEPTHTEVFLARTMRHG